MGRQFGALDGLRGVAALAVVTVHAYAMLGWFPLPSAYLAVDFFFALSGFVLAHAYGERLAAGTLSWFGFMKARLVRLYPLYAVGAVLGFVALVLAWFLSEDTGLNAANLVASTASAALFLPAPISPNSWAFPLNVVAWSLSFELAANALYAVIAPRLSDRVLGAIILSGAALLVATGLHYETLDVGPLGRNFVGGGARVLLAFFVGVALYRLWAAGRRSPFAHLAVPAAILLAMMAVGKNLANDFVGIFVLAPMALYIGAHTRLGPRGEWVCGMLGASSYALYVIHFPIIEIVVQAMTFVGVAPLTATPAPFLVLLLVVVGLSLVLERWFDRPVRAYVTRRLARRRQGDLAAV